MDFEEIKKENEEKKRRQEQERKDRAQKIADGVRRGKKRGRP